MLDNLVNTDDVARVYRKVAAGRWRDAADKLRGSSRERVVRQWSSTDPEPCQWWSIPAVRRRWNRMVSGDEAVDFPAHVAARHLATGSRRTALSLGCGMGGRELRWAELDVFDRIDAVDIAPSQVEVAAARAEAAGYGDVLHFTVGDVAALDADERYDVVIAEHSLHHLAPMPEVVARIERMLKPGGLFVVDEFVGPRRFQWSDRQLGAAQALLELLPERYRRRGTEVKRRVVRPSRLWMLVTDPSEAVDSERILPALHEQFDVVEERGYGGAVLHLTLTDIAQNFLADDAETRALLDACFAIEDRLMAAGEVASDFATLVCRKRAGAGVAR